MIKDNQFDAKLKLGVLMYDSSALGMLKLNGLALTNELF